MTFIPATKKVHIQAVIWTRVSTQEQGSEGHSLDTQMKETTDYCTNMGLKVIKAYSVSESGSKFKRPEFYEMVEFVKQQKGTVNIVVVSTDRLHRDPTSFALMNEMKNKGKVILHSTKDRAIYDEESDDIKYHFENVINYNESRTTSRRVRGINANKAPQGKVFGNACYGYYNKTDRDRKVDKDPIVKIDDKQANCVKRIFEMYSTGLYSAQQIAKQMHEEGYSTRQNLDPRKSFVERVLENKFYMGYYETKYGIAVHPYPRIISQELFDKCKEVKKHRAKTKAKGSTVEEVKTKNVFIYNGLIKCKHCGCSFSSEKKHKNNNEWIYLRPTKSKGKCEHCEHIREDVVTEQIVEILKHISFPEATLKMLNAELKDKINFMTNERDIRERECEDELEKIRQTRRSNKKKLMDDIININIYNDFEEILDEEEDQIKVKLAIIRDTSTATRNACTSIFELAHRASEFWVSADNLRKREILNILFGEMNLEVPNLYLDGKTLIFTMRKPFNLFLKEANHTVWLPG